MEYKTGTFIMGRCTVIVSQNNQEYWQLAQHQILCLWMKQEFYLIQVI